MWLGMWSEDPNMVVDGKVDAALRDMYLGVYGALGIGQALSILSSSLIFTKG